MATRDRVVLPSVLPQERLLAAAWRKLFPAVLLFLLAGTLLLALADQAGAAPVSYYLVASSGTKLPGGESTNVAPGQTYRDSPAPPGLVSLFAPATGSDPVRAEVRANYPGYKTLVDGFLAADYARPTRILAAVKLQLAVDGDWDAWRVTLFDYESASGRTTKLGQATSDPGKGTQTLTLILDNTLATLSAGHRLRVQIEVDKPNNRTAALVFNSSAPKEASSLTLDETVIPDTDAPVTSISTSPAAPDGDSGWFRSPVTVTLTARDAYGSPATIYYSWNENPFAVYPGSFVGPPGENLLSFYSVDEQGNTEAVQTPLLKVDASIDPPAALSPRGSEAAPTPVRGTLNLDAAAGDAVSGVNYVAFYSFDWRGTSWNPVGDQIGFNQQTPFSGDTFRASWNTTALLDGRYRIQSQLRDLAGNTAWSGPEYVLVDNTNPAAAITAPAPGGSIGSAAYAISGTASDANLANWILEMRELPAGSFTELASGTASVTDAALYELDTTPLPEGEREIRLTATDTAGNTSTTFATCRIDHTKPALADAEAPDSTTVDVHFDEALSPASVAASQFSVPGLTVTGAALQADGRTVRLTTSAQVDGRPYRLTVKNSLPAASDPAGNPVGSTNTAGFSGKSTRRTPAAPVGPEAFSGADENRLVWKPSEEPDLEGYNVYRDTSSEGSFETKLNSALLEEVTEFTDRAYGTPGVYWYRVSAVAGGVESGKSTAVAADRVRMAAEVGRAGATLRSSTGEVKLVIPPGALRASTEIRVEEQARPADAPPLGFASSAYDLLPAGQSFRSAVEITLAFDASRAPEAKAKLYGKDADGWQAEEASALDEAGGKVTATAGRLAQVVAAIPDDVPPALSAVTPAEGTAGVSILTAVTAVFTEPMDPATLGEDNLQIKAGEKPLSLDAIAFSEDRRTAYLYPEEMLEVRTTYTVLVKGAGVRDLAGNPLGADQTSSFTTGETAVGPHDTYSASIPLCRNCHVVHGEQGPRVFAAATEKEICSICHDGTGSRVDARPPASASPFSWDLGESAERTSHPAPLTSSPGTGVGPLCSSCHQAHSGGATRGG